MPEPKHQPESTFRSYKKDDSKHYAQYRKAYHSSVYTSILEHHTSTGGQLMHILDIGCGPGLATRELAKHFTHATGLDAGEAMIEVARSMDLRTVSSEPVRFEVSTAEDMAGLPDESVDLITSANAAHWFNMPAFWTRAAKVLKPNGSVALWSSGEPACHPDTPNAAAINEAWKSHQETYLKPFFEPGNFVTRDRYRTLTMPWTMDPPLEAFERESLWRKDWALEEPFHEGYGEVLGLDLLERMLATGSPVARWRAANPDAKGTEGDVVRMLRRKIERLLREAGVKEGEEVLKGAAAGVVVMVKKRANGGS